MHLFISPCPNDTFIFYSLIQKGLEKFDLNVSFHDVQTCNEEVLRSVGDIVKVSFAVYPKVQKEYVILDAGSALGQGVGPLLVGHKNANVQKLKSVVVPGSQTTANKLFQLFGPKGTQVIYAPYDQIIPMIISGKTEAGVIIHESRFTYQDHRLEVLMDLGSLWEKNYYHLLPLGGILAKRNLGKTVIKDISKAISESVKWAFTNENDPDLEKFILGHAQEMEIKVAKQHIQLYVNEFSLDLGQVGKKAIYDLLQNEINGDLPVFASDL